MPLLPLSVSEHLFHITLMMRLNINQSGSVNQSVRIKSCVYLKCTFISSTDTSVLLCKRLCEQVHHFIWYLSIWDGALADCSLLRQSKNLRLFLKTLFILFILSGYQSPELNSCTSKRRQWEGRGVCLLFCPVPVCNGH